MYRLYLPSRGVLRKKCERFIISVQKSLKLSSFLTKNVATCKKSWIFFTKNVTNNDFPYKNPIHLPFTSPNNKKLHLNFSKSVQKCIFWRTQKTRKPEKSSNSKTLKTITS